MRYNLSVITIQPLRVTQAVRHSPQFSVFRAVRLGLPLANGGLHLVFTTTPRTVRPVFRRTVIVVMVMVVFFNRVAGPFVPVGGPVSK